MTTALDFLTQIVKTGASDIFVVAGRQLSCKKGGRIEPASEERLMPADTERKMDISGHPLKRRKTGYCFRWRMTV